MKLFLDANVIFSASNLCSQLNQLVRILKERHTVITSTYAQIEAIRNIRAKRPDWEPGYAQIMQGIEVIQSINRPLKIELATKDRPILATAITYKCDYLITGDKRDFGHLFDQTIDGVTRAHQDFFGFRKSSTAARWASVV